MLSSPDDSQVYIKVNWIEVTPDTASGVNNATVDYIITVEGVREHGSYTNTFDPAGISGTDIAGLIEAARLQHVE